MSYTTEDAVSFALGYILRQPTLPLVVAFVSPFRRDFSIRDIETSLQLRGREGEYTKFKDELRFGLGRILVVSESAELSGRLRGYKGLLFRKRTSTTGSSSTTWSLCKDPGWDSIGDTPTLQPTRFERILLD